MIKKLFYAVMICTVVLPACTSSKAVQKPQSQISDNVYSVPIQLNNAENYTFDHLGVVVEDIEKGVEFYSKTFGLAFSEIHEYRMDKVMVKGRTVSYVMKIAFAQTGLIKTELIEITEGKSLHTEFLKTNGPGIHHIAFDVRDLKKEIDHAQKLGIEMVTYFETSEIPVMACFETGNGLILELVQEDVMEKIKEAKQAGK